MKSKMEMSSLVTSSEGFDGGRFFQPVRPHVGVRVVQLVVLSGKLVLGVVVVVSDHGQHEHVREGVVEEVGDVASQLLDQLSADQIIEGLVVNMRRVVSVCINKINHVFTCKQTGHLPGPQQELDSRGADVAQ